MKDDWNVLSRIPFGPNKNVDLKADLEKLSLLNNTEAKKGNSAFDVPNTENKLTMNGSFIGFDDPQDEKVH